jgi:hypothetical protein
MQETLIVLESEIPSAVLCASSLSDSEYYTYVFDTKLVDTVISRNFHNVRIAVPAGMREYKFLDIAALKLAKHDELRINEELKPVNGSLSIRNSQNLNFHYLRIAYLWYSELWDKFISQEPEDNKCQVFACNSAVQYYGPSFLPATLLIAKLKSYSRDYGTTVYQKPCLDSVVLVGTEGVDVQQSVYELIIHLSACFSDHECLN